MGAPARISSLDSGAEFVFGGTFDPVHLGHLAIIQALTTLAPAIPVRLVPCAIPALKSKPDTSFAQRLAMLKLATDKLTGIIIDGREQAREGVSYMVDTLDSLSQEFADKTFILVMGADSVVELTRWFQWQKLASACHLVVLNRPGIDLSLIKSVINETQFSFCESFQKLTQQRSGLVFLLEMPEKSQSSTQIRQFRKNNLELDSMLPQSVIKYIIERHLYK